MKYPTDVGQLRDATRCMVRETARAAKQCGLEGWRQHKKLLKELMKVVQSRTRFACVAEKAQGEALSCPLTVDAGAFPSDSS